MDERDEYFGVAREPVMFPDITKGHAPTVIQRADEVTELWCSCEDDEPVTSWGDPDEVIPRLPEPSVTELREAYAAHVDG